MPIQYRVNSEGGIIEEAWSGTVSIRDLHEYWSAYLADPEVRRLRRTVVDLRAAEIAFTGVELNALVQSLVIPSLGGLDWKTALVVSQPVQYGVSRQYQVFAESYSSDAIFDDVGKAREWMASQMQDE
jgi:hypothetical protein